MHPALQPRRLLVLISGLSLLASPTQAQSPAPSVSLATEDDRITLSPFVVSVDQDKGYAATHSLAGGRINTELIKTPSDVTVLTREFLNDIGAVNYMDAVPFLGSAYAAPAATTDIGTSISFRGIPGGAAFRNYFRVLRPVDMFIIERFEAMRGPNAQLFGEGSLGGVLNTSTKRARPDRSFGEVTLRVDSEGSRYAAVDLNQRLSANSAARVNVFGQQNRFWVDRKTDDRSGVHLTASHRPWSGGEFRVEGEYGVSENNIPPSVFSDIASNYTSGYLVTAPLTVGNPAAGVTRLTADTLTWSPTQSGTVQNLRDWGRTTGSNLAISPELQQKSPAVPRLPRNLNGQPYNVTADVRDYILAAFLDQQFGRDLVAQVAVQYANITRDVGNQKWSNYYIDVNQILPDGRPNPKVGKPYAEAYAGRTYKQDSQHLDLRAAISYQLPFKAWNQRLNLFLFRREEIMDYEVFMVGRNNNPANPLINATANELIHRVYFDDSQIRVSIPANDSVYSWEKLRTTDQRIQQVVNTAQVATVASLWAERITVVGGVRKDDYAEHHLIAATRDAAGRILTRAPADYQNRPTTASGGFVLFPVRAIGVYGNYAETFNPLTGTGNGLRGEIFGPTQAHGYSGGLRFRLPKDRVVGSIGYYEMSEAGRVGQYSNAAMNRIWTNLNKGELQVEPATTFYRDTLDYWGAGWELELTANLSNNFRLRGNYAIPRTKQTNTVPGLRAYFARHIDEWRAGAANPAIPNRAQIATDIATLETALSNAFEDRVLNNAFDYTASVFAMYTIPATRLKGLRLGGGVAWQGPRVIGNQAGRPYDYVKSDGNAQANLSLGYTLKLRRRPIDLQLNVTNLFDYADPVYTGTNAYLGATVRTGLYYLDPRKVMLTATHRF
jgi:outer membrane receptor protein involved in Fe transport